MYDRPYRPRHHRHPVCSGFVSGCRVVCPSLPKGSMTVRATINRVEDLLPNQIQQGKKSPTAAQIQRVTNAQHDGKQAIKFEAHPDEFIWRSDGTHEGSNRTEAIVPGKPGQPYEVRSGSERWIGAWYYLDPAYPWVHDPKYPNKTIMQIGRMPNPTAGSFYCGLLSCGPDGKLGCSGSTQTTPAPIGRWFHVLARVLHKDATDPAKSLSAGPGEIDVYLDGKLSFSGRGRATMGPDGAYLKVGSYGTPIPGEVSRLWIANLIVATTRAEAEAIPTPPPPTPGVMWMTCPKCGTAYHT